MKKEAPKAPGLRPKDRAAQEQTKAETTTHKQALNLRIDSGTVHRLKLHALQKNVTLSDLVTELLNSYLPEYDVTPRISE